MNRLAMNLWAACLLAVIAASATPVLADEGTQVDITLGSQALDEGGRRAARLHEFGKAPEGTLLSSFWLLRNLATDPWRFEIEAKNLVREQQSASLAIERSGIVRVDLGYEQLPHWTSLGSRLLFNEKPGALTMDQAFRQAFEAAAWGSSPVADLPPLLRRALITSGHDSNIGSRRDRRTARVIATPRENTRVELDAGLSTTSGDRMIAAGTYVRSGAPDSTYDRERFDIRGAELLETLDHRAIDGGLAADVHGKRGFIKAGVDLSYFRNEEAGMLWDNPLEAYPGERTIDGQSQANRGRFARGQLALTPDNQQVRVHTTGTYRFSPKMRATATLAAARTTQDQDFLPFTLNDKIFFPGADGQLGTADDVKGTDLRLLPASSLDGEVNTRRFDVRVTANPRPALSLEASARQYSYDNKTPRLDFPGYAAFGESAFRRGIGQKEGDQAVLFNEPSEYTQTRYGVAGRYAFARGYRAALEFDQATLDYTGRQVDKTDETSIDAHLSGSGSSPLGWSVSLLSASREHSGDYEIGLETSKIRMFDVWDRDRVRFGAEVDYEASDKLQLGLGWSSVADDYPGAVEGAAFGYGLTESNANDVDLWVEYQPGGRWNASLGGGVEKSEWKSLAVSKTSWGLDNVNYDPANRWVRNQDDDLLWAEIGVDFVIQPERWTGELRYGLNSHKGEISTMNPATPTINSGQAVEWSDVESTQHEVRLNVDRRLSERVELGLRYAFLPYRIDDPAWNTLQPSMQGVSTEVRGSPADQKPMNTARYLYSNSRYDDLDTHAVAIVMNVHMR